MSRIRSIKPEFFLDDKLAELTLLARLLFIGLWTLADCEGRLEDRPKRIRAQIHPYDDGDTDALLQSLHDGGFINRYTVDGVRYLEIRNFKKHQRLSGKEAEAESMIPPPSAAQLQLQQVVAVISQDQPIDHQAGEATGKQRGSNGEAANAQEGKGRERKGRGKEGSVSAPARPAPARSIPLPDDFAISPATEAWAEQHGYDQLPEHLEAFKGKAQAKGYRYVDWQAALKNAIRDDWAGLRKQAAPGGGRIRRESGITVPVTPQGAEFDALLRNLSRPALEGELAHASH